MPTIEIKKDNLTGDSLPIVDSLILSNIAPSKGQARTLIEQGGISIDDKKITDVKYIIDSSDFDKGYVVIKKGKKVFIKLKLV